MGVWRLGRPSRAARFCLRLPAAERGYIDDVIDPAETRRKVVEGFRMLRNKREQLPQRKHGNVPL